MSSLPTRHVDELAGWGGYPTAASDLVRPERFRQLKPVDGLQITRGMGRSYGDAALCTGGKVILTERLSRLLHFDSETGVLTAEAGATLADILEFFVPQGWFVPVTPGTKFCSLGGCLAADVHGKNHHRDGTFSRHLESAALILPSGEKKTISPDENSELYWATAGGMGLTGIISEVNLKLTPIETAWMNVTHRRAQNIDDAIRLLSDPMVDDHYSVAWIDCLAKGTKLGRSIVMTGHHSTKPELPLRKEILAAEIKRPKTMPFMLPPWVLNPFTINLFNGLYNWIQGSKKTFFSHYTDFFYPLDGIRHWNRMYGKPGFVQYQFVMPPETANAGMRAVLEELSREKRASFLAVLKRFGPQGDGLMSFPTEGYTLSLDIPMREGLLPFLDRLDDIVANHRGRQYLAKDSRLKSSHIPGKYPRLSEFQRIKREIDPENLFSSDLSRRLGIS